MFTFFLRYTGLANHPPAHHIYAGEQYQPYGLVHPQTFIGIPSPHPSSYYRPNFPVKKTKNREIEVHTSKMLLKLPYFWKTKSMKLFVNLLHVGFDNSKHMVNFETFR